MEEKYMKRIVVVGGGFAGINFIKKLAKHKEYLITLVDKNNYHFFPPLLYQVATAFIELSNISYPFRRMFRDQENLRFHLGSLLKIDADNNTIETDTGILEYDYLVLSVGTETNYFGMENVKKNAWPMKTINDAVNLRNQLLLNMEKAGRISDPSEREKHLTMVIAGGGPTGVEVAGMLAEMGQHIIKKEYPEIANFRGRIYLVDAGPALLSPMSKKSQEEATNVLKDLGVLIKLNIAVKDYVDHTVYLENDQTIATDVLIWASGVTGIAIPGLSKEVIGPGRRVMVDEYNKVKESKNVYAIGDICLQTTDPAFPNGHPQLAQVAIQQGEHLALNFGNLLRGKQMKSFIYNDKGSMAIISKFKAVVDMPKLFLKGFVAWVVWLFIHIIPIAGFRNKLKLAANWFWALVSNDPTLRLIVRPEAKEEELIKRKNLTTKVYNNE